MATRMTGAQRRDQLIAVGWVLFAERGFAATSIEEIATPGTTLSVLNLLDGHRKAR